MNNELALIGFTESEVDSILEYLTENKVLTCWEIVLIHAQRIADMLGFDMGTMIQPNERFALIKL